MYYFTSDNLQSVKYIGLTPHDLIDIALMNDLHFDGTIQEGVMFHLIGPLSQYGKLGVVCVRSTPQRAREFYRKIVEVLDNECPMKHKVCMQCLKKGVGPNLVGTRATSWFRNE